MSVKKNLFKLREHLSQLEKKYNRPQGSVSLLLVTKKQSIEKMKQAIEEGHFLFGENYLQEALIKMQSLSNYKLEWHFIGPIQSNKTKKIAEQFDWVESVDSERIAQRLNDQRPIDKPALNICIEVNVSGEKTKSGISLDKVDDLMRFCLTLPNLNVRGLMVIPKAELSVQKQREQFKQVADKFQQLCAEGFSLDTLSMGMSDDYESAIAEGSTQIRIGSAIFGPRSNSHTALS